jgi:hypothetical protein
VNDPEATVEPEPQDDEEAGFAAGVIAAILILFVSAVAIGAAAAVAYRVFRWVV